jgi:diguanylate cyclase
VVARTLKPRRMTEQNRSANITMSNASHISDDEFPLIEDEELASGHVWKLLIVDDDRDVHIATQHALMDVEFSGRVLKFIHAYSSVECVEVLRKNPDIAVALLDVVMDTDDAGFRVVEMIRKQMGLHLPRIILRTGQPGYAPEISAIRDYDINDYKTKSDLTRNKLFITVYGAIRTYNQMLQMEASRKGLEQIVHGCSDLINQAGFQAFAGGVIEQLAALLSIEPEGLLCAQAITEQNPNDLGYFVIAAAGRYQKLTRHRLDEISDSEVLKALMCCFECGDHVFEKDYLVLHFTTRELKEFAVYVKTSEPISDINRNLLAVFCNNVSMCAENVHLIKKLQDHAYFDRQVNLPNRLAFIEAINECYKQGQASDQSVILIDIDHFAEINNAFGHPFGDALLLAFAERLSRHFGNICMIARVSGDTFGMMGLARFITPELIRAVLEKPFHIHNMKHAVAVSSGTVRLQDSAPDGLVVLKDANIARKLAREQGINKDGFYSPEIGYEAKERTELLQQLQGAFDHERLFPVYQPQVDMRTGKLIGFEALMRWRNEDGVYVPPTQFIPLAEQSGLIVGMGTWILRGALCFIRQLHDDGWDDLRISINVSAVQFRMPNFFNILQTALEESQVNPKWVELEITESVAIFGQEQVEETLKEVRSLGVKIALDDFGTGFSSLSYLDRLPIDRLKIDRAFVNSLSDEKENQRFTDLIIQLGHCLGICVIAEGIENQEQAARLLSLGCFEGQGYLYGKPMDAVEMRSCLQNQGIYFR